MITLGKHLTGLDNLEENNFDPTHLSYKMDKKYKINYSVVEWGLQNTLTF